MYSSWQIAFKYLGHFLFASNGQGHGTHSPFVYRFIREVLRDKHTYPAYSKVELLRKQLATDTTILKIEDLGAGSAISPAKNRSVASLVKHAAKPPGLGQLLYRTVKYLQPRNILELGTSLGITTSYLALGSPGAGVYTIEGAGEVASKAQSNFRELGISNVKLIKGNFDDELIPVLKEMPSVDVFFLDGNHRKDPTLQYFNLLLPKMHNDSVMIFDDIHWSGEMEDAWRIIKKHDAVSCTMDLFWIGIVFFRREFYEKQHFRIRF